MKVAKPNQFKVHLFGLNQMCKQKKIQLNEKVQNVLEISLWIFILFFQQKWKSSASASDHKAKKSIIFITAASLHSMKNSTENSFNLFASIKYMHAELIKYKKLFKSEA